MREIQVSNHLLDRLRKEERGRYGYFKVGLVALPVSFVLGALVHTGILLAGVVVFFVLVAYAFSPSSEAKVLRVGIQGEETLRSRLREILSDEYIALFNVPLTKGDIDCFLVGPTGVYLLDSKNHRGYLLNIEGEWIQKKIGRNKTVYNGEHIKAPDLQVKRAIYEVKDYLREKGIKIWIEGAVVFTNPDVKLFLADTDRGVKILVINELESLFAGKNRIIEPEKVEEIATLIIEGFK